MTPRTDSGLLTDATLQAEGMLPPNWRGLTVLELTRADTARLEDLPVARRVSLTVEPHLALIRSVTLPPGTDAARALPIWLEEVTPWATGHYLWDAVQTKTEWQVAVLPKSAVQTAAERVERRGSEIVEITLTVPDGPVFRLRRDDRGRARLRRGLVLVAATLAAVGVVLTLWQGQATLQARDIARKAQAEMAALQAEATTGSATTAALDLRAAQAALPPMADRLALLAARLPLDTWLLHLRFEGATFTLSGRSAAPEAIIPALTGETGPLRTQAVDFDGPIARDAQSGLFSFTIKGALVAKEGT